MAECPWTILYDVALQSRPRELLANVQAALEAVHSRLGTIGSGSVDADLRERRAIFVALGDLHAISVSYRP